MSLQGVVADRVGLCKSSQSNNGRGTLGHALPSGGYQWIWREEMSLAGTLAKVAIGMAVAKGVSGMAKRGTSGGSAGGGGLGGVLGGLLGGQTSGAGGAAGGGLGGLGSLLGGGAGASAAGGMAGGLGGLLEQISGGGAVPSGGTATAAPSNGSLGDLLNRSLREEPLPEPDTAQEAMAKVFIRAMINAAKSDGNIDQAEQQKIVGQLGDDVSDEEREFVLAEMRAPLDVDAFVRSVPAGSEKQVYMMSLMGIELDQPTEAKYLDQLRRAMNVSEQDANAIHSHLGAPILYS